MLEWHDKVKDIKENIELKGIEATVNNVEEHIAISVKSLSELERRTVIEKLKIERRYWMGKGVKFYVITEK